MKQFGAYMFTDAVKRFQDLVGARETYERVAERPAGAALGDDEIAFIESRDSFYIASVNADGWPYVQHRGGEAGFLKVLGPTRIGFADYRGNRQFVTTGNLAENDRVSLFLMDYPRKARLKILGHASLVETADNAALAELLPGDSDKPSVRLFEIEIAAFDWNCPKYISPRFTEADIETMLGSQFAALNQRLQNMEALLTKHGIDYEGEAS